MSNESVFSAKLLVAMIGVAVLALVVSLYFSQDEGDQPDRLGPSSYSTSALGYAGIASLLEKLGASVDKSRGNSVAKAQGGVLVLAEPRLKSWTDALANHFFEADKILLVLPKWQVREGAVGNWVRSVSRKSQFETQFVLNLILTGAGLAYEPSVERWTTNTMEHEPPKIQNWQLIRSDQLRPLVASEKGILLGEFVRNGRTIWILSDPDVIANHAFTPEGKDIAFAVQAMMALRGSDGAFIFDETIHGFMARPSTISRLLFEFPYIVVTGMIAAAIALLLWATMGRFGPPVPAPAQWKMGKQGLVENVAKLMDFAGYQKLMVERYVVATIRDTARQVHAPKGLSQVQMIEFLDRAAKARDVKLDGVEILARADKLLSKGGSDMSSFVDVAKDIHRWKQEILDGPSRHPRNH